MYNRLVLLGLFAFCLSIMEKINGQSNDELKLQINVHRDHIEHNRNSLDHIHQRKHENHHKREDKHFYHHHHVRHHKGLKARQGNSSSCYYICVDEQLAAVASWLNGTKELQLLYNLLVLFKCTNGTFPIPGTNGTFPIPGTNGTFPIPGTNVTLPFPGNNITLPIPGNNVTLPFPSTNITIGSGLCNSSSEYPIISWLARNFGRFLSGAAGIGELFTRYREFAVIWKEILLGLNSGGCNRTDILIRNLRDLLGYNGTFGANLFNFTYWEHTWFSWIPIGHGIGNFLPTNWLGK